MEVRVCVHVAIAGELCLMGVFAHDPKTGGMPGYPSGRVLLVSLPGGYQPGFLRIFPTNPMILKE